MKHTQLEVNQDKSRKALFLLMLAIIAGLSMLISCTPVYNIGINDDPLLRAGTPEQKERFLDCSQNEGDAGCDSCYYLVYGKHIDMMTGAEIK